MHECNLGILTTEKMMKGRLSKREMHLSQVEGGVLMLKSVILLILLTSSLGFVARPLLGPDYSGFAPSSQASLLSRAASFCNLWGAELQKEASVSSRW